MEGFTAPNPVDGTLTKHMRQPLLLLDIDGVISLFGFDSRRPPPGRYQLVHGIPHFLSTNAGELIAELATSFELMWCSGWEEKADEILPAVLGLPKGLAHLSFPPVDGAAARQARGRAPFPFPSRLVETRPGEGLPSKTGLEQARHAARASLALSGAYERFHSQYVRYGAF